MNDLFKCAAGATGLITLIYFMFTIFVTKADAYTLVQDKLDARLVRIEAKVDAINDNLTKHIMKELVYGNHD
jgi:hypothetical protein